MNARPSLHLKVKGHFSKQIEWSHQEVWVRDMAPLLENNGEELGVRVVGIVIFLP